MELIFSSLYLLCLVSLLNFEKVVRIEQLTDVFSIKILTNIFKLSVLIFYKIYSLLKITSGKTSGRSNTIIYLQREGAINIMRGRVPKMFIAVVYTPPIFELNGQYPPKGKFFSCYFDPTGPKI